MNRVEPTEHDQVEGAKKSLQQTFASSHRLESRCYPFARL